MWKLWNFRARFSPRNCLFIAVRETKAVLQCREREQYENPGVKGWCRKWVWLESTTLLREISSIVWQNCSAWAQLQESEEASYFFFLVIRTRQTSLMTFQSSMHVSGTFYTLTKLPWHTQPPHRKKVDGSTNTKWDLQSKPEIFYAGKKRQEIFATPLWVFLLRK